MAKNSKQRRVFPRSIIESGRKPTSWKPRKGLVRLSAARQRLFGRLMKLPGNTQLRELNLLPNGNRFLVKMEHQNRPTGSHYDRVYPHLLWSLERTGITPDRFVLCETSSGNATPAFGYFARKLGYQTVAFLPAELSETRKNLSRQQCDQVVVADPKKHGWGVFGASNAMREAIERNKVERQSGPDKKILWSVNHSQVTESIHAIRGLAKEIIRQLHGRQPDYFVGIVGNGTILYGVGKELKQRFPKIKIIGVEPVERPVLHPVKHPGKYEEIHGRKPPTIETMQGQEFFAPGTGALGVEFPHLFDASKICNQIVLVSRHEMEEALEGLKRKRFQVGHTSAMSYAVAQKLAGKMKEKTIVAIFYDHLSRY